VKTIWPVSWSDDDGKGIDDCPDDVGKAGETGVEIWESGVVISCVAAGDESEEGVEACSVANRSGVGEEPELRKLHPRMKVTVMIVQSSLALCMLQLD
jgi:hypothetical protein